MTEMVNGFETYKGHVQHIHEKKYGQERSQCIEKEFFVMEDF